jgi:hypothetical protein
MSRKFQVLLLIITASLMMPAQTFHITPVITPTTVIDGQSMAACNLPDSVAINASGAIAFTTYCHPAELQLPNMILTAQHIVAKDGDVIDGRHIKIYSFEPIAINSRGQVAYTITWVDDGKDPQDDTNWNSGICVDHHFVQQLPPNTNVTSLTLTDDGKVTYNQPLLFTPKPSVRPQPQNSSASHGILGQIPVKLPPFKMPKNLPIGIPTAPQPSSLPSPPSTTRTPAVTPALASFASNNRGQVVIPATLPGGHFSILIATPAN